MEKQLYYYAHSKRIYNTKREKAEEKFLKKKFEVVNPNTDIGELNSMLPYLKMVDDCVGVVCSEVDGFIGKGVYEEVKRAVETGKPTMLLKKSFLSYKLIPIKSIPKIYDENDWKIRYAKLA